MLNVEISAEDHELEEGTDYFFRRIGEVRFAQSISSVAEGPRGKGWVRAIDSAALHGIIAFADDSGVYVAESAHLQKYAVKHDEFDTEPLAAVSSQETCKSFWTQKEVSSLQISPDGCFLAVTAAGHVDVYALSDLSNSQKIVSQSWDLPAGSHIRQLVWQRVGSGSQSVAWQVAILSQAGQIHIGKFGLPLEPVVPASLENSYIASSPDGKLFARGVTDHIILREAEHGQEVTVVIKSEESVKLHVDSLQFLSNSSVVAGCNLLSDDEASEEGECIIRCLAWDSLDCSRGFTGLTCSQFRPLSFNPDACPHNAGPYSHVALCPSWNTAVYAHAKAEDDHVKVLDFEGRAFSLLEVLSPATAIAIPGGPDFQANRVLGLALDFTLTDEVQHPNPEKEHLPGAPLLMIATSDGLLRFYRFGSTSKSIEGVIAAARPLPQNPLQNVSISGLGHSSAAQLQSAAAEVGLPDSADDSDYEPGVLQERAGSGSDSSSPKARIGSQATSAAEVTTSNVLGDMRADSSGSEVQSRHTPVPQQLRASSVDTMGSVSMPTRNISSLAGGQEGQSKGAGATGKLFGAFDLKELAGVSSLSKSISPQKKDMQPYPGTISSAQLTAKGLDAGLPSDSDESVGEAPSPRRTQAAGAFQPLQIPGQHELTGFGSQLPSPKEELGLVQQQAPALKAEHQQASLVQPSSVPASIDSPSAALAQEEQPLVPEQEPAPPYPAARLGGEGEEVEAMEASFLKSLYDTRVLEQDSGASFDQWRDVAHRQRLMTLSTLSKRIKEELAHTNEYKARMISSIRTWEDLNQRTRALTHFLPQRHAEGLGVNAVDSLQALQSLEPPLAAMKDRLTKQIAFLARHSRELEASLEHLEVRRLSHRTASTSPGQPLYEAINAQSNVAARQLVLLKALKAEMNGEIGHRASTPLLGHRESPSPRSGGRWQRSPTPPASSQVPSPKKALATSIWEGDQGDDLRRRLISQATNREGGLIVASDSRQAQQAALHDKKAAPVTDLSPPELPAPRAIQATVQEPRFELDLEPHVPAARPAKSRSPLALHLSQERESAVTAGLNVQQQPMPSKQPGRPVPTASPQQAARASSTSISRAAEPPLPGKALQKQAQSLKAVPSGQPPLPTKALQSQAQALKADQNKPVMPAQQAHALDASRDTHQFTPAGSPTMPAMTPGSNTQPVPGKALQQQPQKLKPASTSQPPMPSRALQAQAQVLKPQAPSQPPLPSRTLQSQAQGLTAATGHAPPAGVRQSLPVVQSSDIPAKPSQSAPTAPQMPAQSLQQTPPAKASQSGGLNLPGIAFGADPRKQLDFGNAAASTSEGAQSQPDTPSTPEASQRSSNTPHATSLAPAAAVPQTGFLWPSSSQSLSSSNASPFSSTGFTASATSTPQDASGLFGGLQGLGSSQSTLGAAKAGPFGTPVPVSAPSISASGLGGGWGSFASSPSAFSSSTAAGPGPAFGGSLSPFSPSSGFGQSSAAGFGSSPGGVFASSGSLFAASTGGAFGQSSSAFGQSSSGFAGFGQTAGGFGGGGFGQPSAFGAASTAAFGGFSSSGVSAFGQTATFGQPSPVGGGFGQPTGFGQPSGFGQASSFGQPTVAQSSAAAFGAAASPNAFGQTTSGGFAGVGGSGFGGVATRGGGWGAQQGNSGFGQATPGFGGFPQSGSGFGGFGGASGGGFGSLSKQTPARPSGGAKMWEMRK